MAERPAWLSALCARQALSSDEFASLLTLGEALAEALREQLRWVDAEMGKRGHEERLIFLLARERVAAALARWEAGPRWLTG